MRKKGFITGSVCLLTAFIVLSANTCLASVTGTVTDPSGNPVSGALVAFTDESNPENEFNSYTDNDGKYIISPVIVEEEIPSGFRLYQNYPNPFNPSTTIPYSLENPGFVNLSIYNVLGQKVRTLIDGYQSGGEHKVTWDACDNEGKTMSAGIYIYQLRSGGNVESKKLLLIDGGVNGTAIGTSQMLVHGNFTAKQAKRTESTTYRVTITGEDIVTYEESGITLIDGETYDFEVIRIVVIEGITFVTIPAGSFSMGSNEGDSDEQPVHSVTLDAFEMSVYEITQGQYEAIVGSNPTWGFGVGDNYPVYFVSWYDAVKFCNLLSDEAGLERCYNESKWECDFTKSGFRLPTEAEWEYACRAGTETKYYTGDSESDLARAGWYVGNSSGESFPVGQKEPNAWGLYDMHGNVFEWCNDWYDDYSSASMTNPTGPSSGSYRVWRGGSWDIIAGYCRSAFRPRGIPSLVVNDFSFRVVRRP